LLKILPSKFLFEFGGLFVLSENHQFEEQKGQSPEYVFVLVVIYESGMALESVL